MAELSKNQVWRDFWRRSIFDFFNSIGHFQTSNCVHARSVDPPTTDMRRLHRQVRPGPDILGEVLPPQVFGASRKVWTRPIPANILRARRRARLRTFRFAAPDALVSTLTALSYAPGYADVPQSSSSIGSEMTTQPLHASPILVTGAAGAVGSIGRNVTEMLLAKGHKVRALVRREDERAEALRQLGAEVMQGDLTDLTAMHRAIEGCERIYFGMSVSADYLTATVNTAAVARHHGVEAFVNMSQMTVTQMSITESTDSPQHKLHWLAEQALSWSGLPAVTMRPTVFLDGFFRLFAAPGVRDADELALPMGSGKTSPIAAVDVARAVSAVLANPTPHIGQIYNLTGFELADLEHYARVFSEALGRTIRYRDVPLPGWSEKLLQAGVPAHIVKHLSVMTELNKQGRYDRMTDDLFKLTGQKPTSMYDFVKLHAAEFTPA